MDVFVVIALAAVALLLAELLLPTGGVLSGLGALGLVAAGVVALTVDSDSSASDWAGPGLITIGVLSFVTAIVFGRKVLEAHQQKSVRTGSEELIGARAEARTPLDPDGQVWVEGSLWRARLAGDGGPLRPGDRVRIEAVEGLTLVVLPEPPADAPATPAADGEEGAG
jgi:membrane-bound serine protease (ClpP class)